ncbi:MAG: hypothetical protein ACR2PG_06375 [Hyphomicrobiaceae bacterium]
MADQDFDGLSKGAEWSAAELVVGDRLRTEDDYSFSLSLNPDVAAGGSHDRFNELYGVGGDGGADLDFGLLAVTALDEEPSAEVLRAGRLKRRVTGRPVVIGKRDELKKTAVVGI